MKHLLDRFVMWYLGMFYGRNCEALRNMMGGAIWYAIFFAYAKEPVLQAIALSLLGMWALYLWAGVWCSIRHLGAVALPPQSPVIKMGEKFYRRQADGTYTEINPSPTDRENRMLLHDMALDMRVRGKAKW